MTNSAKLKKMNRIDVLQAHDTIMAQLREALAVIQTQNLTIAKLQEDVNFLEQRLYREKSTLWSSGSKSPAQRLYRAQHKDQS